ncbi:MAG: NUDIX domain-containing protein [Bacteroidaceae bacterium]|nr:NUDIX domain-containing protein [Bacteroidaceae bacterium]
MENPTNDEIFPIVNDKGEVIGKETRTFCHSGAKPLHPVIHLHILNQAGELYLQKRAVNKDIQPGKWDTAVGGHIRYGESVTEALNREAKEELGISCFSARKVLCYIFESAIEKELVNTHITTYNGEITPDGDELETGRFWTISEIEQNLGKNIFTPNFEQEFIRLRHNKII